MYSSKERKKGSITIQLQTEVFSFEKNNKNIFFISSVGNKKETKKYIKTWCIPTNVICFRMTNYFGT